MSGPWGLGRPIRRGLIFCRGVCLSLDERISFTGCCSPGLCFRAEVGVYGKSSSYFPF